MKTPEEILVPRPEDNQSVTSQSPRSDFPAAIAAELQLKRRQVEMVEKLLNDGGTIPFIARYRKEATGFLDEVALTHIRDRLEQLASLEKRRQAMLASLAERELLSDELKKSLLRASTLVELEDVYLPHRPKKRTRALLAREKGLEPLAKLLLEQKIADSHAVAVPFVKPDNGVNSVEEALAGSRDIIAEWVSEDVASRAFLRQLFTRQGEIVAKVIKNKESAGEKFRDYFDWREKVKKIAGHRLLAILRGEKEKILRVAIGPPAETALSRLQRRFVHGDNQSSDQIAEAVADSYKRLLAPALENETRQFLRATAEAEAINVFAENLRQLLLAPPLGPKRLMALDPGFRTGAKLVCLDAQGKLLHHEVIYPTHAAKKIAEAAAMVKALCRRYDIEAIAIGNGTAGRETEAFVRNIGLPEDIIIALVNESGASIYSASKVARDEFPNHDITVRGAVSIGRRLQDPLAELVKIDPKAIGVGQYQHDVDQGELKRRLDEVVESCVNRVGVEINTASRELLAYVSGLGPTLAQNIIRFRDENGPFSSRRQLLKVPRLGPKAFEQAAGFIRIREGENPLDATAVHPERYVLVSRMAKDSGCSLRELMDDETRRQKIDLKRYVTDTVGMPTLEDIMAELAKPGRDPRREFERFSFKAGINRLEDLEKGMRLPGLVTNVTRFGAFVDIGVHQDGLVHISQLADGFVKDPAAIVKVQQRVVVTVLAVDCERRRISLSLRENAPEHLGEPEFQQDLKG
ncbi:MAG: Tex family protein [Pseudomonadota bacterium]|nr:Tex family protein [Pseudomonadota bacterium]